MSQGSQSRGGLDVAKVSHRFGAIVAAEEIDLNVQPGEVHSLLGPSGSGKSTLMRLVAGLETLQQGSIMVAGRTVADPRNHQPPEARSVGFVFQDYALFPHLDARHNVAFGLTQGTRRQRLLAAEDWLARVGLADHATAMPHTLSGGEQQRVALVRALAREPRVMLLDEPFSGLDQALRDDVRGMTLALLRETDTATLMVTHDPHEALHAGDWISVIQHGRLLQTGSPDDLYRRAASRRVAETFGPINHFESNARSGRAHTPWGDLDATASDGRPLEGPVDILIRPDALVLAPMSPSTTCQAGTATAYGAIEEVSVTGSLATIVVDLNGTKVAVHDLARHEWPVGQRTTVRLATDGARIVPAE